MTGQLSRDGVGPQSRSDSNHIVRAERWMTSGHVVGMNITEPLTGPGGLAARLAPSIKAVTDEIEDRSDLPTALVAELRDAGAFSLLTPRELGGLEAPLTSVLAVYEELSR